jgi:hypothetical protein
MNIKRGAFLILTGVLAHQACSSTELDGDDDNSTGGSSKGGSSKGGSSGGSKSGSGGEGGGVGGEATSSGATGGAEAGGGGADTAGGSGPTGGTDAGGAGGDGGQCDDSVGNVPDCEDASPECTYGFDYCKALATGLKPKIAEAAVKCFIEANECDDYAYECAATALATACPVPENDDFCEEAAAICGDGLTTAECHGLVDGLSEDGFAQVYSCVEGGCPYGLWSCIESLEP